VLLRHVRRQGCSVLPAVSVRVECSLSGLSPVRCGELCSGPQPCHPASHLGSFIKRAGRNQPWGKGDLAVTKPGNNEALNGGALPGPPSPTSTESKRPAPRPGTSSAGVTAGLLCVFPAGHWLGFSGFCGGVSLRLGTGLGYFG